MLQDLRHAIRGLAWVSTLLRDRGRETGMSYPDFVDYRDASRET